MEKRRIRNTDYKNDFILSGMKFTDEEIQLIIELITRHPPPSPAGTLFFLYNGVLDSDP
jgi:hypothetical protein